MNSGDCTIVIHVYVNLFIPLLHLLLINTMDRTGIYKLTGGLRGYSIKPNCLYPVLSRIKCVCGLLRPVCPGYCEMKLVKVTKTGEQLNAGNFLESENDSC